MFVVLHKTNIIYQQEFQYRATSIIRTPLPTAWSKAYIPDEWNSPDNWSAHFSHLIYDT